MELYVYAAKIDMYIVLPTEKRNISVLSFKFQGCITLSYVFAHLVFFGSQINLKRVKLALNFPKINKIVK